MRAAQCEAELRALGNRYEAALAQAADEAERSRLLAFEERIRTESVAVFNRSPAALEEMLRSEDDISRNFYRLIDAGLRLPQSDEWDRIRVIADQVVLPDYGKNIRFAALSLSDVGLVSYGSCTVVLDGALIEGRSSVFETNIVLWLDFEVRERDDLGSFNEVPPGLRATWYDRGRLSVAKLAERLLKNEANDEEVLLSKSESTATDDYVEVHIWGPITVRAITSVTVPARSSKRERLYLSVARERLKGANIEVRQEVA